MTSNSYGKSNPWFKDKEKFVEDCCHIDIFGGTVFPNMRYSDSHINSLKRNILILPDFGFSFRYQRFKSFSLGGRFSFSGQGVSLTEMEDIGQVELLESVYKLKAYYLSLSVPIEYQLDIIKSKRGGNPKTFFYIAPFISTPVSGSVEKGRITADLSPGMDINSLNYGAELGFGFRIPTFSLEDRSNLILRFSWIEGFADTYLPVDKKILNDELYVAGGKRFSSGFKMTLCIEIPLKPKKIISFTAGGDGKKNYKKVVNIKE